MLLDMQGPQQRDVTSVPREMPLGTLVTSKREPFPEGGLRDARGLRGAFPNDAQKIKEGLLKRIIASFPGTTSPFEQPCPPTSEKKIKINKARKSFQAPLVRSSNLASRRRKKIKINR